MPNFSTISYINEPIPGKSNERDLASLVGAMVGEGKPIDEGTYSAPWGAASPHKMSSTMLSKRSALCM